MAHTVVSCSRCGEVLKKTSESSESFDGYISVDINPCPNCSSHKKPQRQDSLTDQLLDLLRLANHEGMYDAADFIAAQLRK
jgi:hypothetical protein